MTVSMRALLLGLGAIVLSATTGSAACREDAVSLRGDWGQARFTVEVADDPQERSRGLMFRETLPRSAGMIFIYEYPQRVSFWMKNTLIPLDLIFLNEAGVVERIKHEAQPGDLTSIPGGDNILVVLEINGGLARQFGMTEGTQMQHPIFAASNAAWPC